MLIIDRFEGDIAVCEQEDGTFLNIDKNKLPLSAKVGDILELLDGKMTILQTETEIRKKRIEEKVRQLFGD